MAERPGLQAAVQAELDGAFGGPPPAGAPDADALAGSGGGGCPRLPLLRACVAEAMRLYPVGADGAFRTALRDTALPGGWLVLKGESVSTAEFAAFTGSYGGGFQRPREFLPQRWLPGGLPGQPAPPEHYLPFAAGPRDCPGQHLAALQVRCAVAALLHGFQLRPLPGGEAPPAARVSLTLVPAAGGLPLLATPRG